jgi:hypothetical protein
MQNIVSRGYCWIDRHQILHIEQRFSVIDQTSFVSLLVEPANFQNEWLTPEMPSLEQSQDNLVSRTIQRRLLQQ